MVLLDNAKNAINNSNPPFKKVEPNEPTFLVLPFLKGKVFGSTFFKKVKFLVLPFLKGKVFGSTFFKKVKFLAPPFLKR
jgi:hypothetical protein